jgi:hypothetical protein
MRPGESAETFRNFAAANGVDLSHCTPRQGVEQMLAFFRDIKPVGCEEEDGDMLLFQYGTYDWGRGRWFELDITRQFLDLEHVYEDDAEEDEDEDEGFDDDDQATMSQLHLTFRFKPAPELDALGGSNRWNDGPMPENRFVSFVSDSPAMALLADRAADQIELDHGLV